MIVFAGRAHGISKPNILAMRVDGTDFTSLTYNGDLYTDFTEAQWSPDGTQILYTLREPGKDAELYLVNTDGSSPLQLTHNSANDFDAVWSPTGHQIAFASVGDGLAGKIWILNSDGSGLRRLTSGEEYTEDSPAWSPTGDAIAYVACRSGMTDCHLRVAAVDGSYERRLTAEEADIGWLRWSPDGEWIVYMTWGETPGIWFNLITPDGATEARPRGDDSIGGFLYPAWSSDGNQLAMAMDRVTTPNRLDLAVLDVATLTWRVLAKDVDTWSRCWLPSGRILYRSGEDLWVVNADGSNAHMVVKDMGLSDCYPR